MRGPLRSAVFVLALVGMSATVLWASDPPYAGSWKLNPARSDFGDTTVTYEVTADGQMRFTGDGHSYTFKADGKDYPTPWGNSSAWKSVDASTWEITSRVDEKVVGTATVKLGADGQTLTLDARNIDAAGKASHNKAAYQRVSGGPGLAGKWKTENLEIGSPGTMTVTPNGPDGLTLTFVEEKGTCSAKFDGQDQPATGPVWPPGWTCALAESGTNGFTVTWRRKGEVMYEDAFTLSADGKILTDVSGAPGTGEKATVVYERE